MAYQRYVVDSLMSFQPRTDWDLRPTIGAMKKWAEQVDDQSYTFDQTLRYFQASPVVTKPDSATRFSNATPGETLTNFNAHGGPLTLSWPKYATPFGTWAMKGLEKLGIHQRNGFTGGSLFGADWPLFSINPKHGYRESSVRAFFQLATKSGNVTFYAQSLAKQIVFDDSKTAKGVLVKTDGSDLYLSAKREVILSSGVFKSPQLLMLSGVGPKDVLSSFKIPVVANLPGVGKNLQDQPGTSISYRVNVVTSSTLGYDAAAAARAADEFKSNATGPLSTPGSIIAFDKVLNGSSISGNTLARIQQYPDDWPDLEYIAFESSAAQPADGNSYASLVVALLKPMSRGYVTLGSSEPLDKPIVNVNWLTDPSDQELMVEGFKRLRSLWKATGIAVGEEFAPGKKVSSNEDILNYIRSADGFSTTYHASSTCAMGSSSNADAVVDSIGKVFGVKSLRICDASILPFLPPGHPQAAVYMLAEKIAASILAE
jgi:choline dehydrogenase